MRGEIKKSVNRELITVIIILSIAVMAMALLQPVLPLYLTSIGVIPSVLGLMFSVAMIGMVFGESSGGWVADKIGLKIPMSIGTFVCAPVVLSFIFTRSTPSIFIIFLFWGIVRAAIFGPGRGYIGNSAPLANKATFIAILATTQAVFRSFGTLASGFIADNWGYNWDFFVSAGLSVLAGIIVLVGFRNISLVKSEYRASLPSYSDEQKGHKPAVNYRSFTVQCITTILFCVGLGASYFLPLLATQVAGVAATQVGILFTISALVTAALLIPMGRLADRRGKKVLMITGLLVSASGLAGIALVKSFPLLILFVVINSIGTAMFSPSSVALLSNTMPAYWQSTAMGVYGAAEDLGFILGSAVGGFAWASWGPSSTFLISSGAAILGAIICASLVREKIGRSA
jgi:MFS family permease